MQQIKQWYAELEESEQKIVLFGSILLAIIIFYFGLLNPLHSSVEQLQSQVKSRQNSVDRWKQAMPKILANRGQTSNAGGNQALNFIVTSTTKKYNMRVSRVQEKGNDEIQVWFDNIPFNDFIQWVSDINNKYGVTVASVNIRSKERNGLSSIDIKIIKG